MGISDQLRLAAGCLTLIAVMASSSALGDHWDNSSATYNLRNGVGAPPVQWGSAACWTGQYMFMFGGGYGTQTITLVSEGHLYDPSTDSWLIRPNLNGAIGAPSPRRIPFLVPFEGKIFLFGGAASGPSGQMTLNTGGVYDPTTDVWETRPNLNLGLGLGCPSPRCANFDGANEAMVWTGSRIIIFGGTDLTYLSGGRFDGGSYDPATDTWESAPELNSMVAGPVFCGPGVWTGTHLIVRGGNGGVYSQQPTGSTFLSAGGIYSPDVTSWVSAPNLRIGLLAEEKGGHFVAWTGEYLIEFGGRVYNPTLINAVTIGTPPVSTGLLYRPANDSFVPAPNLNSAVGAPPIRNSPYHVWTGAQIIVYGGSGFQQQVPGIGGAYEVLRDGYAYSPASDMWTALTGLSNTQEAVSPRLFASSVWANDRWIFCAGKEGPYAPNLTAVNTGAIYVPPRVAPSVQSPVPVGNTPTTWAQGGTPPGGAVVQVGQFWRHRITAYGCPVPDVAFTGLAPWMSVKKLDTGAFIQGTPTANDAYTASLVTVFADNGIGNFATQSFIVSVTDPAAQIAFQNRPGATAYVGVAYSYSALNSGIVPTSLSITAKLVGSQGMPSVPNTPNWPSWLSWNGITLSGTPPAGELGKQYDFQILATQGQVYGYQRFTVTVALPTAVSFAAADVNDDNLVDVVDVQLLVNWILAVTLPPSPQSGQPIPGDVNQDAVRDVVDVQAVVNKILSP